MQLQEFHQYLMPLFLFMLDANSIKLDIDSIYLVNLFYSFYRHITICCECSSNLSFSIPLSGYLRLHNFFFLFPSLSSVCMIIAGRTTGLTHSNRNKRRRVPTNPPIINYINLESTSNLMVIAEFL